MTSFFGRRPKHLVFVPVFSMLRLSNVVHPANWAFTGLVTATIVAMHWADVCGGILLTFPVRVLGGGFGRRVRFCGSIITSGKGEGEQEDQQYSRH